MVPPFHRKYAGSWSNKWLLCHSIHPYDCQELRLPSGLRCCSHRGLFFFMPAPPPSHGRPRRISWYHHLLRLQVRNKGCLPVTDCRECSPESKARCWGAFQDDARSVGRCLVPIMFGVGAKLSEALGGEDVGVRNTVNSYMTW